MSDQVYSRKDLLDALKAASQPSSKAAFSFYSTTEFFPQPDYYLRHKDRIWPLYTKDKIEEIVLFISRYRRHKKAKPCSQCGDTRHYARGLCTNCYAKKIYYDKKSQSNDN